jgi:hypothetical protein
MRFVVYRILGGTGQRDDREDELNRQHPDHIPSTALCILILLGKPFPILGNPFSLFGQPRPHFSMPFPIRSKAFPLFDKPLSI